VETAFRPAGDRGLVVEFADAIRPEVNDQVRALALALDAARLPGLVEAIPTYRSLGIEYDPTRLPLEALEEEIRALLARVDRATLPPPRVVELPTVYGGEYGPDLPFVASHTGLTEAEVVRLHSQTPYRVYMIGFTAGFAYLGGLPERLQTPRLTTPRVRVPRGSVGIGGSQTGAYPAETPGGWQLIGRTPVPLFDPFREPPTPMQAGDAVHFVPVDEAEYRRLAGTAERAVPDAERPARGDRSDPPSRTATSPCLEVQRAGVLTTVQDLGRPGYQRFGVPVSGAMDPVALQVANILVGNPPGAAGLEATAVGPCLRFHVDAAAALTGGRFSARLDGQAVPWYESFMVHAGQVLDIQEAVEGFRAYLAVGGGLDLAFVLGSRSTCLSARLGGLGGRKLTEGDRLEIARPPRAPLVGCAPPRGWAPTRDHPARVRVVLGPQAEAFGEKGRQTFLSSVYQVTPETDRMGCRLQGPVIAHAAGADIISDWIPSGGIQVPGSGQPIILLADRQTTGGYTKIATVIGPDLPLVAQSRPGDALRFRAVSVAEAQEAARRLAAALAELPGRLESPALWAGYMEE
jgi:KipI family sensor histidine kinase inhibitor